MKNVFAGCCIVVAVTACSDSNPPKNCGVTSEAYEVSITGISSVIVSRELADGFIEQIGDSEEVLVDQLHIRLELDYDRILQSAGAKPWTLFGWIFDTAYACSPQIFPDIALSPVASIDLLSNEAFGDAFLPGVSLSGAFDVWEIQMLDGTGFGSIGEKMRGRLYDYDGDNAVPPTLVYEFRPATDAQALMATPNENLYEFTFSVSLENGEMFTGASNLVQLTN